MAKRQDYQSGLFREETYAQMEGEMKPPEPPKPPKPEGAEVAILQIMHDRKLQKFIRRYA